MGHLSNYHFLHELKKRKSFNKWLAFLFALSGILHFLIFIGLFFVNPLEKVVQSPVVRGVAIFFYGFTAYHFLHKSYVLLQVEFCRFCLKKIPFGSLECPFCKEDLTSTALTKSEKNESADTP